MMGATQPRELNGRYSTNLRPIIAALDNAAERSQVVAVDAVATIITGSPSTKEFTRRRKLGGDLTWVTKSTPVNFIASKPLARIATILLDAAHPTIENMLTPQAPVPTREAQPSLFG